MTLFTGISALRANQTAMGVVGHNIANVSTEGYRRQEVLFAENPPIDRDGLRIGTGVHISDIRSVADAALEDSLASSTARGGALEAQLAAAKKVESLFLPNTGNIQERTEDLFLDLERLSALPTESSLRSAVIHSASNLAQEITRVTESLDQMLTETELEIRSVISEINDKSAEVHKLNSQIIDLENTGQDARDLRNRRDVLVKQLAELIDVERITTLDGKEEFLIGGGMFSVSSGLSNMELIRDANGKLEVWKEGCTQPHTIGGGKLAGLLAQSNLDGGIQTIRQQVDEFTSALVHHLDGAHATGVGIGGAHTQLATARRIEDVAATLASQDTVSPVTTGRLFISVNDENLATTQVSFVDFDPSFDTLTDLTNRIDSIQNLSANVDSTGRMSIVASPGFTFDFTGNLQTHPDPSGITGTARPTISGRYTGSDNQELTFRVVGNGTVGVTDGLQVAVQDGNGLTIRVLDIGRDYEPESKLVVADGVEVAFSSGQLANDDIFDVQVVAKPDETGLLAALGLNTLFVGNGPLTLAVNPLIEANNALLATTTNGDPSDTRNLHRMLDVRNERIFRDGTITMEQFLSELTADVGNEAAELQQDVASHDEQHAFLQDERDMAVGVDVNEELARMLQYQRSYQAAARYLTAVDSLLHDLFQIIR